MERACQYLEVQNRNRGAPEANNREWMADCLAKASKNIEPCMRVPCGKRFYNCLVNTFNPEACIAMGQTCTR